MTSGTFGIFLTPLSTLCNAPMAHSSGSVHKLYNVVRGFGKHHARAYGYGHRGATVGEGVKNYQKLCYIIFG